MELLSIFFSPSKVFERQKESPKWAVALIIVLAVIAVLSALTVVMTKDAIVNQQIEAMKDRGMSDEQIEQAVQFMGGPVMPIGAAVSALVFTAILLLIFAALTNALIPAFGGRGSFRHVFSVVSHAALIRVPGGILRLIVIAATKSHYVTTSLVLLAPGLAKTSFLYRVLAGFDLFIIWEMIVVAIGISVTNGISKRNAYVLVGLLFLVSVFIGAALGGLNVQAGPR